MRTSKQLTPADLTLISSEVEDIKVAVSLQKYIPSLADSPKLTN